MAKLSHYEVTNVFEEDSAPAHRARETVDQLINKGDSIYSIPATLWPPNSRDLNPVDCRVRPAMQETVSRGRIENVDKRRSCILRAGDELDQIRRRQAVSSRLRVCVTARG